MKISVVCILVFVCCISYCSLGTTEITTNNDQVNPRDSTFLLENVTNDGDIPVTERIINDAEGGPEANIDSSQKSLEKEEPYYLEENEFLEVAQNAGVAHEISSPSLEIIHTLADTPTLELHEKADELAVVPTISDTSHYNLTSSIDDNFLDVDKDIFQTISSIQDNQFNDRDILNQTEQFLNEVLSTEPKINITEEIPSFSEWTQKQLEEAEKRKEEVNASIQNQFSNGKSSLGGKKRWKNYASPDCGAKIVAANPEAISAGSVLTLSRDEYKLNTCTSRIWFVVELCEAIQATKIDLANFELFSSSPKDFSISVSDRFTNRDWSSVGQFTAKDERDIQSFDLRHHLFGKFIKFEMHSHHGSEHYCPISLFRVYGTSEFEVLETENQVNIVDDDDDEETLDSHDGEPPKNLFSSATDAVISMVKKAAEALGNKGNRSKTEELTENKTTPQYLPLVNSCTTPSHIVICENCTDLLFGYVFELLSCKAKELGILVKRSFINKTLYYTNICTLYGLDWRKKPSSPIPAIYKDYMMAFFAPKYIAALCNTVAVNECKVVLNVSHNATIIPQNIENIISSSKSSEILDNITVHAVTTETAEFASTVSHSATLDIPDTSLIKPTKTLTLEENLNIMESSDTLEDNKKPVIETPKEELQNSNSDNAPVTIEDHIIVQETDQIDLNTSDYEPVPENSEGLDESIDTLVADVNEENTPTVPVTTASPPTQPQQQQKETVFLRLSNRLKALELNMSLSGQYLEELSRRYKKQVEEMQRLLDKTIINLNEDNRKKEERADRLEQQIDSLKETVESLIEERNAWVNVVYWLIFIVTVTGTVLFCKRNPDKRHSTVDNKTNSEIGRRKSISVVTHKSPKKKKRRPSEEALLISGTYKDLVISNDSSVEKSKNRKRKRQKLKMSRSNSVSTLTEELHSDSRACKTVSGTTGYDFAPLLTSSRILNRQHSSTEKPTYSEIQDIPFVLEESENSGLEPLPQNLLNTNENSVPTKHRKFTVTAVNSNSNHVFKKSASLDNSSLPLSVTTCEPSLNGSVLDGSLVELPRREKRNFLKKIFRNLSMK